MTDKKRLNNLLWSLMKDTIADYLKECTPGSHGCRRADYHIKLCNIYLVSYTGEDMPVGCNAVEDVDLWEHIHDESTMLTAYMDERIDFPIDKRDLSRADLKRLAPLFFKEFLKEADRAYESFQKLPKM